MDIHTLFYVWCIDYTGKPVCCCSFLALKPICIKGKRRGDVTTAQPGDNLWIGGQVTHLDVLHLILSIAFMNKTKKCKKCFCLDNMIRNHYHHQ